MSRGSGAGSGPGGAPDAPRAEGRWRIVVEDALILLAIPVLWLTVLRLEGPEVLVIQMVTLAVMVWIMAARLRRLWAARRRAEDDARKL